MSLSIFRAIPKNTLWPGKVELQLLAVLAVSLAAVISPLTAQSGQGEPSLEELVEQLEETEREARRLRAEVWALRSQGLLRNSKEIDRPFGRAPLYGISSGGLTLLAPRARLGLTVRLLVPSGDDPSEREGALVQDVTPHGPADQAGLRPGDLITHWNGEALAKGGKPVSSRSTAAERLAELTRALEAGDPVELTYRRDSKVLVAEIEAAEGSVVMPPGSFPSLATSTDLADALTRDGLVRPYIDAARALGRSQGLLTGGAGFGWLGILSDLEAVRIGPEVGAYFGTDGGLLVLKAATEDLFGLEPGDVILAVGDRTPRDLSHAMEILRSYRSGETINLQVQRQKKPMTLTAEAPERSGLFFSPSLQGPDGLFRGRRAENPIDFRFGVHSLEQ